MDETLKGLTSALDPSKSFVRAEIPKLTLEEKLETYANNPEFLAEVALEEIESTIWRSSYENQFERRAKVLKVLTYIFGKLQDEK